MLFKLSNLNSNLALTLGYLNRALNNSAQVNNYYYLKTSPKNRMLRVIFGINLSTTSILVLLCCHAGYRREGKKKSH